ncbi:MAG TPA: hypothetical protein VE596_12205 [Gaiellaceae bacterium]|jgi:hypothetical protein|nr:hypothetical protein [Gaiellaceae bacterium]
MAVDLSKLHEVATRVVHDPSYAEELKKKGMAALQAGPGSAEMDAYFDEFAATPGALAGMGATGGAAACTCNSATWVTLSSIVTPVPTCCGATTTTTTSTNV